VLRLASTGETLFGPIKQRWKRSRDDRAWRRCALGQVVRISAETRAAVDAMREHLDGALMMRIDVNPGQRGDLSLCLSAVVPALSCRWSFFRCCSLP
jgi:hypothetical protein